MSSSGSSSSEEEGRRFQPRLIPRDLWGPVRLEREAYLRDEVACVRWCVEVGLFKAGPVCRCRRGTEVLVVRGQRPVWYCPSCRRRHGSVTNGSVFEGSRIPLARGLLLAMGYAHGLDYRAAVHQCAMEGRERPLSYTTIARWYKRFRRVVGRATRARGRIGGPGQIVQMDECCLGRRKHHRGRRVPQLWVVGGIDQAGQIHLDIVPNRAGPTLLRVALRRVQAGSTIHTDEWRGYLGLDRLGFTHKRVNHRRWFVGPDGTHTQRVEALWRAVRRKFSRGGIRRRGTSSHLREFMWRRWCARGGIDAFGHLLTLLRAS